jgi:NAD dependent epimerase/dehydratase family enzyme
MLGEGAYAVLTGQRALPKRTIEDLHYEFRFEKLDAAFADLVV